MDTKLDLRQLAFEYRNAVLPQHAQKWLEAIEKHVAELVANSASPPLRDYFAAASLAAVAAHEPEPLYYVSSQERVARVAYQLADAMLAAREAQS